MKSEKKAIKLALELIKQPWTGNDDFSRGMRILQMSPWRMDRRQTENKRLDKKPVIE